MKFNLSILLLVFAINLYSQNPHWEIFNTENSEIPSNDLYCLTIRANNEIWMGTSGRIISDTDDKGLIVFDGVNWLNYNTKNSNCPNDAIECITFDKNNELWAGTFEFTLGDC